MGKEMELEKNYIRMESYYLKGIFSTEKEMEKEKNIIIMAN